MAALPGGSRGEVDSQIAPWMGGLGRERFSAELFALGRDADFVPDGTVRRRGPEIAIVVSEVKTVARAIHVVLWRRKDGLRRRRK